MVTGFVDVIERGRVAGWAADPNEPNGRVSVLVLVDGYALATLVCDLPRDDLGEVRFGDGLHGFALDLTPPLSAKEHRIDVVALDTGEPLPNGRRLLLAEGGEPAFAPVLVTAPGRSGTTLLMSRLSQSPEICVGALYPFEIRMLAYYATAFRVLTAPADLQRSTHPDALEGNGYAVGFNPFSHADFAPVFNDRAAFAAFFAGEVPNTLAAAMRRIVVTYYRTLAADQDKNGSRMFAEKNNNLDESTRQFTRYLFGGVKELVLVRDPRDIYLSKLAYFKHAQAESAFTELTEACAALTRIRQEAGPDTMFVWYEAMIFDQERVLDAIGRFLGVAMPAAAATKHLPMRRWVGLSPPPMKPTAVLLSEIMAASAPAA